MSTDAPMLDAAQLRAQLNDPQPMQRARALHLLEQAIAACPEARLAGEAERFTARGIPFYRPDDRHFAAWVDRAVALWERLQAPAAHRCAA
ncbi:hypothetical protein [Piscinibacter sakaiensis]|uniref:Uncharacterized protein n=1 Tax=Piscinibacter sakaiensis TaxID=1547922 RepID=A0A0K8P6F5_PISS1|nr:hypothetical protein [Piscinibacter sakaiensis]GAP37785.1 hypothetical protein ISF6_3730 [Piscinibacter sakaiensis]